MYDDNVFLPNKFLLEWTSGIFPHLRHYAQACTRSSVEEKSHDKNRLVLTLRIHLQGGVLGGSVPVMFSVQFLQQRNKQTKTQTLSLLCLQGVWQSRDELRAIRCSEKLFQPIRDSRDENEINYEKWKEALARSRSWYS